MTGAPGPARASAVVRPATAADLPAIVAMRDDLNALELSGCPHAPIQKLSVEDFARQWGHTLDHPSYCWRIVELDGRPIGFGLIYLMPPVPGQGTGAFVHWAYLRHGYRGQGVGRHLLEHLYAWARAQNATRVELQYIEGNRGAEAFWNRLGFRSYARKCVHYLEPDQRG